MRAQHATAQNGNTGKRTLPYNRQYVLLAVYEVLDKNNAEYEKADASTIAAEIAVYGNLSRFSISVKEQEGETELRVTMARPCEGAFGGGDKESHNRRDGQHREASGKRACDKQNLSLPRSGDRSERHR